MSSFHRWLMTPAGFVLVLGLMVLGGCQMFGGGTEGNTSSAAADDGASQQAEAEEEEVVYDPQEGMTKDEIRAMYRGEPDQRSVGSDATEVWTYHVNAGEAWIPFNFGYRPRFHQIHFNAEGVVERYTRDD